MSPFSTGLVVADTKSEREWVLVECLRYRSARFDGQMFSVPSGFITDFASVPRLFWSLIPPTGRHSRAAVVHDWLYVDRPMVGPEGSAREITRKEADQVFHDAMHELGVARWRCITIYSAVRLAGWLVWSRCRAA